MRKNPEEQEEKSYLKHEEKDSDERKFFDGLPSFLFFLNDFLAIGIELFVWE